MLLKHSMLRQIQMQQATYQSDPMTFLNLQHSERRFSPVQCIVLVEESSAPPHARRCGHADLTRSDDEVSEGDSLEDAREAETGEVHANGDTAGVAAVETPWRTGRSLFNDGL